jgi:5'(3')-deoxyribonucleotidase
MKKPVILIDCDMVLLNFNQAIANAYEQKFNKKLKLIDSKAFKAIKMYELDKLPIEEQMFMKTVAQEHSFWKNMPAMEGAVEFVKKLSEHFELVVLTSMPVKFEADRMENLQNLGMPVSKVIAVARVNDENPKKTIAQESGAVLFIDDLAHNFTGLNEIATKLVLLNWDYSEKVNDKRDGLRIDYEVSSYEQFIQEILPKYTNTNTNTASAVKKNKISM